MGFQLQKKMVGNHKNREKSGGKATFFGSKIRFFDDSCQLPHECQKDAEGQIKATRVKTLK